jgi:hypothetical protein
MEAWTTEEGRGVGHMNSPGLDQVEPLPLLLPPSEATGLVVRRDRFAKGPPSRHPVGGP